MHTDDIIMITLPLTPSVNEINSWRMGRNIKKLQSHRREMQIAVSAAIAEQDVYIPQRETWAHRAWIYAIRYQEKGRQIDQTNLVAGLKATEDALVSCRIIHDDSPRYLQWGISAGKNKKDWDDGVMRPCTRIYIQRLEMLIGGVPHPCMSLRDAMATNCATVFSLVL